jgi:hypothetical protein
MQELEAFYCSVGINMNTNAGKIWSVFNKYQKYTEVDAEKFDINAQHYIMRVRATLVRNLCKEFGFNADALVLLDGILSDLCMPLLSMDGDLFAKTIIVSGHYATAELNCLFILIMCVFTFQTAQEQGKIPKDIDFFDHIAGCYFGDDQGNSVSEIASAGFNNIAIKESFELFNMSITASDKCSSLTEFVDIEDATFLKRSFRYSPLLQKVVAPLDINSIYKMCSLSIYGKSCTPLQHDLSVANSALPELFIHACDEPNFKMRFYELRAKFIDTLRMHYGDFDIDFVFDYTKCMEMFKG